MTTSDDEKVPVRVTEAADVLALARTPPPAAPEALAEGLRYLQQRIPGLAHLTGEEKRSRGRTANLDPEFIEAGLHAAGVWHDVKHITGRTGEELREEQEEIRRWDHVVVELRAITNGIEGANTNRKHELGRAILAIYKYLGSCMREKSTHEYMRPYYENMRRAFLRTRAFRRKKKKEAETQ